MSYLQDSVHPSIRYHASDINLACPGNTLLMLLHMTTDLYVARASNVGIHLVTLREISLDIARTGNGETGFYGSYVAKYYIARTS